MGIRGNYLRVTLEELDRAIKDPGWGHRFAMSVIDAESVGEIPTDPRHLDLGKAWQAIFYILDCADFPTGLYGEQCFVDVLYQDLRKLEGSDVDWGYGPPRYLTSEQVRLAAEALADTTFDDLIRDLDPAELVQELIREEIYPEVWHRPGELEWAGQHYLDLPPYFAAAARAGDALIHWID